MERLFLMIFFFTMFLIGTNTFIISPLLPTLRELYHVSTNQAAWLIGTYALGFALTALVAGPLSDNRNRKHVMAFGMLGFALSTLACAFAPSFAAMLFFRFLAGTFSAFIGPQVWAAIPVLFPPARIGKAMGIVMAGLSVSQVIGVPIGSFLSAYHWSFPFLAVGIASLGAFVLIIRKLPDLLPPTAIAGLGTNNARVAIFARYMDLLRLPQASRSFIGYFVFMTGVYAVFSFYGVWLSDQYQQSVTQIGLITFVIGLGNTVGSLLSGWLLERWKTNTILTVGFLGSALLYLVLPYIPGVGFLQVVLFFMYCFGGVLVPVLMGYLQSLSDTSRGTISSLANACMYIGTFIASSFAGNLYSIFGFAGVSTFATFTFLIAYLLFVLRTGKLNVSSQA
ncbi:MFS transporter [Brevibacillus porteri]|uniref:MFS transporter n=1 Tax=Brevibacillus porteri TaxID=2126350 RepID=UPI003D1CA649